MSTPKFRVPCSSLPRARAHSHRLQTFELTTITAPWQAPKPLLHSDNGLKSIVNPKNSLLATNHFGSDGVIRVKSYKMCDCLCWWSKKTKIFWRFLRDFGDILPCFSCFFEDMAKSTWQYWVRQYVLTAFAELMFAYYMTSSTTSKANLKQWVVTRSDYLLRRKKARPSGTATTTTCSLSWREGMSLSYHQYPRDDAIWHTRRWQYESGSEDYFIQPLTDGLVA